MGAYDYVSLAGPPQSISYDAPFKNFMEVGKQIGELPNDYFQGRQMGRTLEMQKPILGPDGQPSTDYDTVLKELIRRGGGETAAGNMKFLYDQKYGGSPQPNPYLFDEGAPQPGHSPYAAGPANLRMPNTPRAPVAPGDPSGTGSGATAAGAPTSGAPAPAGPAGGEGGGPTTITGLLSRYVDPQTAQTIAPRMAAALSSKYGQNYGPNDPISDPMHLDYARTLAQNLPGARLAANDAPGSPGTEPGPEGAGPGQGAPQPSEGGGAAPVSATPGSVPTGITGGRDPMATVNRLNRAIEWERQQAELAERRKALGIGGGGEAHLAAMKSLQSQRDEILKAVTGERQEQFKSDTERFGKEYGTYNSQGIAADQLLDKVQLAKSFTNDPNFYSGAPAPDLVNKIKAAAANFGAADPNAALRPEGFNKVVNDMLINQVRALAGSGVGRVLLAEVNAMRESIASLKITPASNRALLEITERTFKLQSAIGQMARDYKGGHLDAGFDTQVAKYVKAHPLFTEQEKAHPEMLGAPQMRAGVDKPGDETAVWGLKRGDPYKTPKGDIRWVE